MKENDEELCWPFIPYERHGDEGIYIAVRACAVADNLLQWISYRKMSCSLNVAVLECLVQVS